MEIESRPNSGEAAGTMTQAKLTQTGPMLSESKHVEK